MLQNVFKNETGRSMVEMLGVLAIAAIITMGGISGYYVLMKKFRSNVVLEVIAEASVEAQKRGRTIHLTDLSGFDNGEALKCVDDLTAYRGGQVKIKFTDSQECKQIMQMASGTFARCRWVEEGRLIGRYVPERGAECSHRSENGCTRYECDDYIPEG